MSTPPRIGAALWVIARHPAAGARLLAEAGYPERVQWLVANHEWHAGDDVELQALAAADNANLPRR